MHPAAVQSASLMERVLFSRSEGSRRSVPTSVLTSPQGVHGCTDKRYDFNCRLHRSSRSSATRAVDGVAEGKPCRRCWSDRSSGRSKHTMRHHRAVAGTTDAQTDELTFGLLFAFCFAPVRDRDYGPCRTRGMVAFHSMHAHVKERLNETCQFGTSAVISYGYTTSRFEINLLSSSHRVMRRPGLRNGSCLKFLC